MFESISKNNELENEMTSDMSDFWYSDAVTLLVTILAKMSHCTAGKKP